ncbi:hypothetical protein ACFPN7_11865 [Amycolatopsis halotolerans]|uniref:hypothetical protein n=1 Tax=Amycolatopsis halotolerans TaxID=330083 RepID=UPI0036131ED1
MRTAASANTTDAAAADRFRPSGGVADRTMHPVPDNSPPTAAGYPRDVRRMPYLPAG